MLQAVGVTGPQRLVIRIVGRFPGISAGGLARIVHLHPSTLSGVLERLERHRLVQRRSDARDKRRALFRLTAKGRTVDERSTGTIESAVAGAIVKLPRAKLEAASEVLEALAGSLEGTRRRARRPSRSTD
ncbi:MAG TPA: MarR family transcriptional regulator [Thermoanaerobaculia bacterium]|nr:MarR family transcriptional regulator [Thermoanaerobaculia bacterium]